MDRLIGAFHRIRGENYDQKYDQHCVKLRELCRFYGNDISVLLIQKTVEAFDSSTVFWW